MIKKLFIGVAGILLLMVVIALTVIYWANKFSPSDHELQRLQSTLPSDIRYLQTTLPSTRGKVLAVVTSTRTLADTGKPTGYELTELARAYWIFTANGFEVDIASPKGGEPYALLDNDDMGIYDYAFLNDMTAQHKAKNTINLNKVKADNYQAIYFVGGKGAMFDFADNPIISNLTANFASQNKVIAAVCHGPAALINVKAPGGEWLVANKKISAFTNSEELLLIPNAETIFPFLLQTKLEERGANFITGSDYLEQVSISQKLITGQNPWSVWKVAEETVRLLGYDPLDRMRTPEENSVELLKQYQKYGLESAEKTIRNSKDEYYAHLLIMHSLVAFMKGELVNGTRLIILTNSLNQLK